MRQTSRRIPECSSLPVEATTLLGAVLDVYLLAADVLLDDLRPPPHALSPPPPPLSLPRAPVLRAPLPPLPPVLAQPDLFLGHRPLVDHYLFLGHRHGDLVLADLRLGGLAAHRHPLDGDLLVLDGDLDALAVGPHALADLDRAGLALAGTCAELLFAPLDPQLVVVRYLGAGLLLVGVV